MKKIILATAASFSLLFETAFAVGESLTAQISQIELIDYIIVSGLVVFVLGLLMIMLSFVLKGKKRADEFDEDDFDELEAYEDEYEGDEVSDDNDDDEGILDDDEDFDDNSENCEEESEQEYVDDTEEPIDEAVEEEADEADATEDVEEDAESNEEAEYENSKDEIVVKEEPEEVNQKARISFTGQNNSTMKFIEFEDNATVGRRKNNDFVITDGAVSGNHCKLSLVDGKVYIEDMNSTNGTFICGEKITKAELNSGDVLLVGQMSFKVNIDIIN